MKLSPSDAAALRRHNADRPAERCDPEIAHSIAESIRPIFDRLAQELALCIRYYAVTFRSESLLQCIIGGGEANDDLVQWLGARLEVPCELGNPLRSFENSRPDTRLTQWDIAAGLALRNPRY